MRILVVEDEPRLLRNLAKALRESGYAVDTAEAGDDGLAKAEIYSAAAHRISAGNLAERIIGTDPDNELGRLASVLNNTFARLEAAFAQQKQFTADASHELRTPIAVLISEAQTALAHERTSAEYREAIEANLETAQQMRRLTESLLELSRLDANQQSFPRNQLDLAEQTRACIDRLRPLATERDVAFHCNLAPACVVANADRFGQVVSNLLTNAIHYNKPRGQIRVTTQVENSTAILTISDTGVGIAPEDLPHVFGRFYRADKARSRADGHTGLGLAICQAIVRAEGGSIEAASQPDVGSTFTVCFPVAPSAASHQG
jgi:two-component system, OmpR family, sensor kinase